MKIIFGDGCDDDTVNTVLGGLFNCGFVAAVTTHPDNGDPTTVDIIISGLDAADDWYLVGNRFDEVEGEPTDEVVRIPWDDITQVKVY